jgi:hypothetical protein
LLFFQFFIALIILTFATISIRYVVVGNPLPSSSNNNQTCNRKEVIKHLCNNTKQDMAALFRMIVNKKAVSLNCMLACNVDLATTQIMDV